jgi:hypothetical protein
MHDCSGLAAAHHTESAVVPDVRMCQILDMNSNDFTCLYSILLNVIDRSKAFGIDTPCVTFDQPLWLKALEVSKAKDLNILCRLGPFHVMMIYLGSLGSLMSGSGLAEVLQ